ncbi:MAG: hypothetical protein U0804_01200 [Gemmataceae bacterium]
MRMQVTRLGGVSALFRAGLLALSAAALTGCDKTQTAAPAQAVGEARPVQTTPTSLPVDAAPELPPKGGSARPKLPSTSELAAQGEALRSELETLDASVQDGLLRLAEAMKGFEGDRRKWTALDRSVEAARAVNKAMGARNKAIIRVYDAEVAGSLTRFDRRLKEAPALYRAMAEERRRYQVEATLHLERRSYLAMAELCEAAAVLCERRHEEIFGVPPVDTGMGPRRRRANATSLAETIDNMRRYGVVHQRWEETFASFPTTLDDRRLSALFDHIAAYAEDFDAFTKGVESLKDAMERKADAPPERPAAVAPEAPAPEAAPPAEAPPVQEAAPAAPPVAEPQAVLVQQPQVQQPTYVLVTYRMSNGRVGTYWVQR